jgi:cysteine-rich repeat protein
MRSLLALLLLPSMLATVACGDGSTPTQPDASTNGSPDASSSGMDAGTGLDEDGCRILTLGRRDFEFNLFGQITGLRYLMTPNLDGPAEDYLLFELYDSTTEGGLPALMPGTFDLAASGNDDLATCQHCFWVKVDETESGTVAAIYYQSEGTLTLDRVSDPIEPVFAGSTSRVVLRRATVTDDGHSVFTPGGDCVSITGLDFDTAAQPGRACLSAEDCANPLLEICDPATNLCAEPQCGEFMSCPEAGQICVSQYRDLFFGGCYRTCDPTATAMTECAPDQRCVQFGVDPSAGICKYVGEAAVGAACEPTDNGTSCAGDAICSEISLSCAQSCGFFDEITGCSNGSVCNLFGVCVSPSAGSVATIGAPCGAEDELAAGCAPDGQAFRGICFAYPPEAPVCQKACLGDRGCDSGEFCALRFTSGLGVCLPVPVCGDGALGEIDEQCDDGNTSSMDGCSGDCRSVEYEVICSSLAALPFAVEIEGDTASSRDGFQNSCQVGLARAALYTVSPPGPGRLTLHLTSATDQTVALRSACADVTTELGCAQEANAGETEELVLQVTSTRAPALTAIVSAFHVLEEGPFTLRAEFVAEQCGDGVVAGNEVCDDRNTASSDGCSGDCRTVEYDFYCAAAPLLSTTALNTGDNTNAPSLFRNSCSEGAGSLSGGDVLYRYVAPSAGKLHLFLDSPTSLMVGVLEGCGRPNEVRELACNATFTLGTVDVDLTAGQAITVFVDGFRPEDRGTYTLEATFTPD